MADLENKVIANSNCLEATTSRWAALLAFLIGILCGNLALAQANPAYSGLHAPLVQSMDSNKSALPPETWTNRGSGHVASTVIVSHV